MSSTIFNSHLTLSHLTTCVSPSHTSIAFSKQEDLLAIEEPMEISIEQETPMGLETTSVYVTMRTPGHDLQLAQGFLYSEGFIQSKDDILSIKYCGPATAPFQIQNIVKVTLHPAVDWKNKRAERQVQGNSSCGLCGITSLQAVKMGITPIHSTLAISAHGLLELEKTLKDRQPMFAETGGIHAVSLFNEKLEWIVTMEDVGRHNAMDKLIGYALENQLLPLNQSVIVTTSRASFELVQKSSRAGCAILAAVSAPSSLAVQLAQEVNQTLIGFLRQNRFNIYATGKRVLDEGL